MCALVGDDDRDRRLSAVVERDYRRLIYAGNDSSVPTGIEVTFTVAIPLADNARAAHMVAYFLVATRHAFALDAWTSERTMCRAPNLEYERETEATFADTFDLSALSINYFPPNVSTLSLFLTASEVERAGWSNTANHDVEMHHTCPPVHSNEDVSAVTGDVSGQSGEYGLTIDKLD
jgi:hypothetical protein